MDQMAKKIVLVRNDDGPADDRVASWLSGKCIGAITRKPFAGEHCGEVDNQVAGTVIYGGKYNACETDLHPFLNEEYRWIEACLEAKIPMLGICQGAQQIAYHLGAWAGAPKSHVHEFGYYEIQPSDEGKSFLKAPLYVAQAHYHTFNLPDGAIRLAGNTAYPNQAVKFRNNVFGFQFHAEQTIEGFRRWQNADWAAYGQPGAQTREQQNLLMARHDEAQAEWFYGFLDTLFGSATAASQK